MQEALFALVSTWLMKPLFPLLTLVIAIGFVFATDTEPKAAAQPKALRVLLITGGCCHDYETQKMILADGICGRVNAEVEIIHEEAPEKADERKHRISIYEKDDWAKGYDVIVHNECFGGIDDNAFVQRIAKPHFDGIPAVMLHCSSHSYRAATTDEWRKCLGIKSTSHEKRRDLLVKNLEPTHPTMQAFPKEWLDKDDELYKNEWISDTVKPLAKAFGEETKKDHVLVWTNQYGKGRVFATTMGHQNSTVEDPVFLDLVARGLLWACDQLDSDGKPKPGFESRQK